MSCQMDLSRVFLISCTLLPNSFTLIRTNLVRSSSFDGLQCLRNSYWAARTPSWIFLRGMVKAHCIACLCSAYIWGSWTEIKSSRLRTLLNEFQITMGNIIYPNEWEWGHLHLVIDGTPVNGYLHTRKPWSIGGLESYAEIKRIVQFPCGKFPMLTGIQLFEE